MDFERDWFMRQLELLIEGAARELLHKPTPTQHVDLRQFGGDDLLWFQLCGLLAKQDFCAAEDLLWENIRPGDPLSLELAGEIYRRMGEYSDETLEAHGFSRQEISDGLERAREYIKAE